MKKMNLNRSLYLGVMGLLLVMQIVSQIIYTSKNFELNMKISELEARKVSLIDLKSQSYNKLYKQYSLTNIDSVASNDYVDITNTFTIEQDSYIASR